MRLVRDIVAQLHLEAWTEESAIGDGRGEVPNLYDVKLTLRRNRHACDALVVVLEE